eukprot:14409862-Heterocapsa_arctica.AAC.1
MVIARMPEDRSKTFKNLYKLQNTFKAIYTCMCTPSNPRAIVPGLRPGCRQWGGEGAAAGARTAA